MPAKKSARTAPDLKNKKKKESGPPRKPTNKESRPREFLIVKEVNAMIEAAKDIGRHGDRDALLILMTFRHALRLSEVIGLTWDQVDFKKGTLEVTRLKNGEPSTHYLEGDELKALRKLYRSQEAPTFVFMSERQGPLSPNAVYKLVSRAGIEAGLKLSVHPHMLRHGKGFQLALQGVDTRSIQGYMGHKNIQHTSQYTQVNPKRFKGLGKDVSI